LRIAEGFLPAYRRHGGDQGAIVKLRGFTAQHHRAVAHHRDVARQHANFRQLVRDKDNPDAERLQGADLAKQPLGFARREGGRGFVEDQDPGVAHQPAQDLHHLLIRHFQGAGGGVEVKLALQLLELLRQPLFQIAFARQAEQDVFPHRQVGEQQRLLRHQINAEPVRLSGREPRI
jgi:hypothetical protein